MQINFASFSKTEISPLPTVKSLNHFRGVDFEPLPVLSKFTLSIWQYIDPDEKGGQIYQKHLTTLWLAPMAQSFSFMSTKYKWLY